jgi:hypothetical protein
MLAGCSGSDAGGDDASSTTVKGSGRIEISTKPAAVWQQLGSCPMPPQSTDPGGSPADDGVEGVVQFGKLEQTHVQRCVDYPVSPTVGGPHFQVWATCGFYSSPVPQEMAAHSMEHGAVWITFRPDLGQAELEQIKKAADASDFVLASPYAGLTSKIVMSAWSRQLPLVGTDDPRFGEFIDTYVQGHQTPEMGPPCKGGVGNPD